MAKKIKEYIEGDYLQVGCGKQHIDGYINMDISNYCNPDIQHDIRKGFPMFKDSQFQEVLANGVLEMIHPNEEFLFVLNELHRITSSGGLLVGQVPSTDPRVMGLDPFDKRWFMEETFDYWNVTKHPYLEFGTQYGFLPWKIYENRVNENGIINFKMSPHK
jgi:hypothetical protein